MSAQRILGIDPGSRYTGYGVIEKQGNRLVHIASGRISTLKEKELPGRLALIYHGLLEVIQSTQPTVASLEKIFHSVNPHSSLILGHARGVAMLVTTLQGLQVHEYAPTEVKSAVVGQGKASKDQVSQMVTVLLNLDRSKKLAEDESDALGIAICHANTMNLSTLKQHNLQQRKR